MSLLISRRTASGLILGAATSLALPRRAFSQSGPRLVVTNNPQFQTYPSCGDAICRRCRVEHFVDRRQRSWPLGISAADRSGSLSGANQQSGSAAAVRSMESDRCAIHRHRPLQHRRRRAAADRVPPLGRECRHAGRGSGIYDRCEQFAPRRAYHRRRRFHPCDRREGPLRFPRRLRR